MTTKFMIKTAQRHIETIHGLPEGTRKFLAGSCLILAAIGMFYSWRYTMSVRLTDLSQSTKISEARRQELAGETNVLVLRDRGGLRQEVGSDGRLVMAKPEQQANTSATVRSPGMFDWIFSGIGTVVNTGIKTAAVSYDTITGLFAGNTSRSAVNTESTMPSSGGIGSLFSAVIIKTQETIRAASTTLERSADVVSGALERGFQKIETLIDAVKIK